MTCKSKLPFFLIFPLKTQGLGETKQIMKNVLENQPRFLRETKQMLYFNKNRLMGPHQGDLSVFEFHEMIHQEPPHRSSWERYSLLVNLIGIDWLQFGKD